MILIAREKDKQEALEALSQKHASIKVVLKGKQYPELPSHIRGSKMQNIKWELKGVSNLWYPINVQHRNVKKQRILGLKRSKVEDNSDGYIVLSKKNYRLSNRMALKLQKTELEKRLSDEVDSFIKEYNRMLGDFVYKCVFEHSGKFYNLRHIVATSPSDLNREIQSRLDFLDDDFDKELEVACNLTIRKNTPNKV